MKIQHSKNKDEIIYGPAVAVDVLIFSIIKDKLNVLLIEIGSGPYDDQWALPGGLVQIDETLDQAAKRVLKEKGGISNVYLEQLYSFSDVDRDVRGRVMSVAYFALVDSDKFKVSTMEHYTNIEWKPVEALPKMAFDHKEIIKYGVRRLQDKIEYSNIIYGLLPKSFTLTEMQKVYEIVLGREMDKRNFRKRVLSLGILKSTGKKSYDTKSRPAKLYQFKERKLIFTK
ncbi:NUDIX domain-containing protein [Patescibacteria group bacterium]